MTEAEWLASINLMPMLWFLKRNASNRKMRLFACACVRSFAHLASDFDCRSVLDVGERMADSGVAPDDYEEACSVCACVSGMASGVDGCIMDAAWATLNFNASAAVNGVIHEFVEFGLEAFGDANEEVFTRILRDTFGNPFRPNSFSPSWRTDTAVALAARSYESRDFSAMPILADALQDAGCDRADILDHCRGTGPHVRGCWVVDLVLGKS